MSKSVKVKIKGISALLMHSFPMVPIEAVEKKSPQEQAELAAYRDPETKRLYIPGIALQRAIISGATYTKGKGRGSLQKNVAACLQVTPERIDLGTADYVIDARPVVIPATKGRVIRYRPRLDAWTAEFELEFDEILLTDAQLHKIVSETGSRVGLLDFRPEKKGPHGRFLVTHWESK